MSRILVISAALALLPSCSCASTEPGAVPVDSGKESGPDTGPDARPFPDGGPQDSGDDEACKRAGLEGNVVGCSYVAYSPSRSGYFPFGCLAVVLVNPGDVAARLEVTWKGTGADLDGSARLLKGTDATLEYEPIGADGTIPPHRVALVSLFEGILNGTPPCPSSPVQPYINGGIDPWPNSTANTFLIETSEPTLAYQVWPYMSGAVNEQTVAQLRSMASWTTSYVDVGTYRPHTPDAQVPAFPWTAMVASVDGTSFAVPSSDAGVIAATLMRDQVLNVVRDDLLIGHAIEADHPFGLVTGSAGYSVPFDAVSGNPAVLPVPPVHEWGNTIAFARQDNRFPDINERTVMRIVAAADGTALTYSPSKPDSAPDSLDAGGWTAFDAWGPFVVQSQDETHPIFLAAHMVSSTDIADEYDAGGRRGANTLMAVPPVEPFGKRYDFFTLTNFPNTELVVVRAQGNAGVVLDCAGSLDDWQPIDDNFEFARVWLSRDTDNAFTPQVYPGGTCNNGAHTIRSDDPFGVMVYGWVGVPFGPYNASSWSDGTGYAYAPLAPRATKEPPPEKDGGPAN